MMQAAITIVIGFVVAFSGCWWRLPISQQQQQQQQQQHGATAPREFPPYQDHSASENNPLPRNDVPSHHHPHLNLHLHLWNSSKTTTTTTTTIPLWMKDCMVWACHSSIKSNLI
jgi:hypothetical protein